MISCHLISDLAYFRCHTGVYFRFEGDLRIFTEVTCATIEDFTSFVLRTCCAPDATLGHIFHFIWDLWFFRDVACSMIDDFMMPDLRPIIRSMPYWGILPFWMRFTYLGGVAYLSPFAYLSRELPSWACTSLCFDVIMLSFQETPLWSMGLIQLYTWMTWIVHSMRGDLSSSGFSNLSHIWRHTGAYSSISIEICRFPTDLHDHPQFWDTHRVDDLISLCPDTSWSLSWLF